jgi:hypothetical protein
VRIARDTIIAGHPAFTIRDLLRTRDHFNAAIVEHVLRISEQQAQAVLQVLIQEEYLEPAEAAYGKNLWSLTIKGCALCGAKAGKPITRKTADRLVGEFLQRVEDVNACTVYAYRVARATVFGSYLSDRPDLGDIDLAVELTPKWPEEGSYEALTKPRIKAAFAAGRRFRSIHDELGWPQREVVMHLKNGSRAISLMADLGAAKIPEGAQTRVLYEFEKTVKKP